MLEPRQLNDADEQILDVLLADGSRLRPTHIAEDAALDRSYVSQRLKRLVEHGHVARPRSGLYVIADDPREDADD
jgi:DNA-binding MarR family transcriptional regulator